MGLLKWDGLQCPSRLLVAGLKWAHLTWFGAGLS